MTTAPPFSPSVVATLRRADRALRMTERGDNSERYSICRTAIGSMAPVDSFLIGFFEGDGVLACTYTYDAGHYFPPETVHLGPHSLASWIKISRSTYRYDSDGGKLMRRTIPFGDRSQISLDAMLVPLVHPGESEVAGVMNVQTLQPHQYGDEIVRAAEWLARALMTAIARDDNDVSSLGLYALYPELDASTPRTDAELVDAVVRQLRTVQVAAWRLADLASSSGVESVHAASLGLAELSAKVQTDISELMRRYHRQRAGTPPALAELTPRELQIAQLIGAESLTNAELAVRLHISPKTVKAHVGSILRKLSASQRSEIAYLLQGPKTLQAKDSS